MQRWRQWLLLAALALPLPGFAAEPFDYWMLSLSWSPEYCASGKRPDDRQCERSYRFVVHGLWPQYRTGYPDYCGRTQRVPDELVERMLPLMPSEKLVQHQWRKHGSCSGMAVGEYFLQTERARRRIVIPETLDVIDKPLESSIDGIEKAFMEVNPGLRSQGIALQCSGRWLSEVRICFDHDFQFRDCGLDIRDRCRSQLTIRPSNPGRGR